MIAPNRIDFEGAFRASLERSGKPFDPEMFARNAADEYLDETVASAWLGFGFASTLRVSGGEALPWTTQSKFGEAFIDGSGSEGYTLSYGDKGGDIIPIGTSHPTLKAAVDWAWEHGFVFDIRRLNTSTAALPHWQVQSAVDDNELVNVVRCEDVNGLLEAVRLEAQSQAWRQPPVISKPVIRAVQAGGYALQFIDHGGMLITIGDAHPTLQDAVCWAQEQGFDFGYEGRSSAVPNRPPQLSLEALFEKLMARLGLVDWHADKSLGRYKYGFVQATYDILAASITHYADAEERARLVVQHAAWREQHHALFDRTIKERDALRRQIEAICSHLEFAASTMNDDQQGRLFSEVCRKILLLADGGSSELAPPRQT